MRYMRFFIVVFVAILAGIALVQYHSTIVFIVRWAIRGALSGSFLGPFFWGLFSRSHLKASSLVCLRLVLA